MRRSSSYRAWALATTFLFMPAITMAQAASPVVAVLYFDHNSIGKARAD